MRNNQTNIRRVSNQREATLLSEEVAMLSGVVYDMQDTPGGAPRRKKARERPLLAPWVSIESLTSGCLLVYANSLSGQETPPSEWNCPSKR